MQLPETLLKKIKFTYRLLTVYNNNTVKQLYPKFEFKFYHARRYYKVRIRHKSFLNIELQCKNNETNYLMIYDKFTFEWTRKLDIIINGVYLFETKDCDEYTFINTNIVMHNACYTHIYDNISVENKRMKLYNKFRNISVIPCLDLNNEKLLYRTLPIVLHERTMQYLGKQLIFTFLNGKRGFASLKINI
mgnify:CR=1 FL=1